jgi:hypothetical protein
MASSVTPMFPQIAYRIRGYEIDEQERRQVTEDAKEMEYLRRSYPGLREFPGITVDDVLGRCRGCRRWLLARGTGAGREGVPPDAVAKMECRLVCAACHTEKATKATRYAVDV